MMPNRFLLSVKYWLQFIALAHVFGGLMLPFVVQLDLVQPYFRLMANVFAVDSNQDLRLVQFMVGVFTHSGKLGSIVLGSGDTIF
ncbi:MAG: hypothetical protein IPG70_03715 [Moraxellaceae bacterium]|nr:hypothetical protein [Moraxellaceae bacterium]